MTHRCKTCDYEAAGANEQAILGDLIVHCCEHEDLEAALGTSIERAMAAYGRAMQERVTW